MYKLYRVSYVNAGTSEYFCEVIEVSNDPDKLLKEYQANDGNEGIEVEEFIIKGFNIDVEKAE